MLSTDYLYENIPCGCLSFYPDGTIISINQTLLCWLGYSKNEVVGHKKFDSILSVGGWLYYQMVIVPLLSKQGQVTEINFDIKVKDGKTFPSLLNATRFKIPGTDTEVITAIILKITDRKKYESDLLNAKRAAEQETRRFETLCNVIPNIIWTALPNGEVNFLNNRFFDEFNLQRTGFKQMHLLSLFHEAERKELSRYWKQAIAKGEAFEAELRVNVGQKNYVWHLIQAVPYTDDTDNITLWFGSCMNVHEHKEKQMKEVEHLNESLTEASDKINEQDRTLQEISYSQSHLVRKPLANILGLVEMIDTGDIDEIREVLQPMLKQSADELDWVIKSMIIKA